MTTWILKYCVKDRNTTSHEPVKNISFGKKSSYISTFQNCRADLSWHNFTIHSYMGS